MLRAARDLQPHEVTRFLRLCVSPGFRGPRRVPIAALSVMIGISRKHLHAIILGANVSVDVAARLTPLIRDIERGKIAFRRHGPHDAHAPNGWEIIETLGAGAAPRWGWWRCPGISPSFRRRS